MNYKELSVLKKTLPFINPIKGIHKLTLKRKVRYFISSLRSSQIYYLIYNNMYIGYMILEMGRGRYYKFSSRRDVLVSPIFIVDKFRNKGLSSMLYDKLPSKKNVFAIISAKNIASIKSFEKVGFTKVSFLTNSWLKIWLLSKKETDKLLYLRPKKK